MLRVLLPVGLIALTSTLTPRAASAQIPDNAVDVSPEESTVNIKQCPNAKPRITFEVTLLQDQADPDENYVLMFGDECGDSGEGGPEEKGNCTPGAEGCCQKFSESDLNTHAGVQPIHADIPIADFVACNLDPKTELRVVLWIKGVDKADAENTEFTWSGHAATISLDLTPPGAPATAPEVEPGETTATLKWDTNSLTGEYQACVFRGDYDPLTLISEQSLANKRCSAKSTDGSEKIEDLEVDLEYLAVLVAFDGAGNESLPSDPTVFRTEEVTDFYELYRDQYGGGDPGGYCASVPGAPDSPGPLALLALLAGLLFVVRRWRRLATGAALALLLTLTMAPAVASAESPKFMTFEFRVGSWLPGIDREFGNLDDIGFTGPYERIFGDDTATVIDLEFGFHVYQGIGTASVGFGLGQGSVDAQGIATDGTDATEATTLSIQPLSLFAGYAFDWPAHTYGFPLIPYAKFGIDWVLWSITNGEGETTSVSKPKNKGTGEGGTTGWHYAVGVRLLLDSLAPEMARTFDLDMGVNNSYVFVEYLDATIDDFGDDDSLHLGAEVVFWGLAFDF